MGIISYNHGNIADGVSQINVSVGNFNGTLEQLRAYLSPLVSTWEGKSAIAYQGYQQQWDVAAAELTSMLGAVANATGLANDGMANTDRQLATGW